MTEPGLYDGRNVPLAYFRFEGGQNITEILESIKKLTSDSSKLAGFEAILKAFLFLIVAGDSENSLATSWSPRL